MAHVYPLEKLPDAAPELEVYLIEKLTCFGLGSAEDIELIDAEDLRFDGVPEWRWDEIENLYLSELTPANF